MADGTENVTECRALMSALASARSTGGESDQENAAESAPATGEEPAMSEPTPNETAAGQAPAATATTPAPAADPAAIAAAVAEALEARDAKKKAKQDKKARKAAGRGAAESAAAQPGTPAADPSAPAAPAQPAVTEDTETARLVREGVAALLAKDGINLQPQETQDQKIQRMIAEEYTRVKQDLVASGRVVVERQGLSADGAVDEHRTPPAIPGTAPAQGVHPETGFPTSWPDGGAKPLHQWTSEEITRHAGAALDHYVMGSRAVSPLP
jgi:hypothetical protein